MTEKHISHNEMVEIVAEQFKTDAEATAYLNEHPRFYINSGFPTATL
jgi:hypothetical protein